MPAGSPKRYLKIESPELIDLAARIRRLLMEAPALQDPLDYALGAVYSLMYATALGYEDRDYPLPETYLSQTLLPRCTEMSEGWLRTEGKWSAGYYFNSALVRISADYERILKFVTGETGKASVPDLLRRLDPPWTDNARLEQVRVEVNEIKHGPEGLRYGRGVKLSDAVLALQELVRFIEGRRESFSDPAR